MLTKSNDSSSKSKKSHGEPSGNIVGLQYYLQRLTKQIQAERVDSVKERVENNRKKLETHVSQILSVVSRRKCSSMAENSSSLEEDCSSIEKNGIINMLSTRIGNPLCMFNGPQVLGDKDYANAEVLSMSRKLPYTEKIPRYITWIFLDKNLRMNEDQSVVGRRRIYYDHHGGEALICSDSEEDLLDPEEVKHEFSEGEDRILWVIFQEHGIGEDVLNLVSHFIGVTTTETQERYKTLKEKNEQNLVDGSVSRSERGISLEKSLSTALDSFDNIFCRRCLLFDCRLHGCSQAVIDPNEKQSYWSEYEDDRKPCNNQCFLQLRAVNSVMVHTDDIPLHLASPYADSSEMGIQNHENLGKRKSLQHSGMVCNLQDSSAKKQKKAVALGVTSVAKVSIPNLDQISSVNTEQIRDGSPNKNEAPKAAINAKNESPNHLVDKIVCISDISNDQANNNIESGVEDVSEVPKKASSEWKPIENDLYLKGVEIFGRNSCLIARNLLSGFKTCIEVWNYMHYSRTSVLHRSTTPKSVFEEDGKSEEDNMALEMPTSNRRRGKTRKLKYSRKSAGHPSSWKRIADGKDQLCRQYAPCGCLPVCGKECSCLKNGTCCEKYCSCSRNCKNRFRGCHCAKSQCRSRQCPCFAAGRECDPDVCRNCWISCGDGSLGEPELPKQGDGQCGNMRLLLRQQKRILLGKSDISGWGAFLKNPANKNDYLGEYTGEVISHEEADRRGKLYDLENSSFLFDLNDQSVLDAYRMGDKLKFANHSSKPNCYAKVIFVAGDHRVGIFAKERIEATEELFYDYCYGPNEAPVWAKKPEGHDSAVTKSRARKHQSS